MVTFSVRNDAFCYDLTYHRLLQGANSSRASNLNPGNESRDLIIMAVLIEHPHMGLMLFETGCAEDVETVSLRESVFFRGITKEDALDNIS